MTNDRPQLGPDEWSAWLLEHRHGRDPVVEKALRTEVAGYVDRILDAAQLEPAMTLADVGTGDGVVAFRAIERVGPSLRVLMADISAPLLRHAESLAAQRNVRAQCTFFQAPADDLAPIADACVDVVTTRAALAYVADKRAALREFHRILRPGGRVCVAEPILQDDAIETIGLKRVADANRETEQHEVLSLLHRWKAAQFPDTTERLAASPIANVSERDLLGYFQECDFSDIHLELHIDVRRAPGVPWNTFLRSSPHPWAPTHGVIFEQRFTHDEREVLEQTLRPTVETGSSAMIYRIAYLSAVKPLAEARTPTRTVAPND